MEILFDKVENVVGKADQHSLLFSKCFQKAFTYISNYCFCLQLDTTTVLMLHAVKTMKYILYLLYPFPKQQILDTSKLKEFADDNFEFNENGRKLSRWVENMVGKGEIARYEQFLLFPQCFQKPCTADT